MEIGGRARAAPDSRDLGQCCSSSWLQDVQCSRSCWGTMRYGNIDGTAATSVIGWDGDVIEVWKWNGSGWTQLAGVPNFAANAHAGPVRDRKPAAKENRTPIGYAKRTLRVSFE
jgi:hypothetical protein